MDKYMMNFEILKTSLEVYILIHQNFIFRQSFPLNVKMIDWNNARLVKQKTMTLK